MSLLVFKISFRILHCVSDVNFEILLRKVVLNYAYISVQENIVLRILKTHKYKLNFNLNLPYSVNAHFCTLKNYLNEYKQVARSRITYTTFFSKAKPQIQSDE